ncbi:protein GOLM2-like isoform X3 [Scylla paramamosain]|uniref:protein GOLM2-like isoform X3 n=1 Tax=Scylla paramamosain TaxID=85552 RepID=UPI003083390F
MIRRGGGRAPPVILIGLLVVLVILGFNYWLLSSQNADLQQELEKLQAEVKISAVKQDQSEKKNAALQETVHEMDEIADKLKKRVQEEEDAIKTRDQDGQKKDYEITSLKNKIVVLQEQINTVKQQVEEQEVELAKARETNTRLVTERDAAVEAVGEKDTQINALKIQLEQVQEELAAHQREQAAVVVPEAVPGAMNIPGIDKKEAYFGPGQLGYVPRAAVRTLDKGLQGINFHRGLPILPRDPPGAPRPKPRFSVGAGGQNAPPGGQGVVPQPPAAEVKAAPVAELQKPLIQPAVGQYLHPIAGHQHYQALAKPRYALPQEMRFLPHPRLDPIAGPGVVERPAAPVDANNQALAPPANVVQQDPHNEVLAPPPAQGDNLEGRKDNGNLFEPHRSAAVIAKPGSLQGKAALPGQDEMAVGLHHGQAEAEDKNDAQEQLDEPLQPLHSHGEVEGEDHNNALEQEEDEDNLDAAVDDENAAAAVNDLTYDQDEEGNDVRQRQRRQDRGDGGGREGEGGGGGGGGGVGVRAREEDVEEEEEEEEEEEGALMLPRVYQQENLVGAPSPSFRRCFASWVREAG